ncbi:unnamed protein product [Paramecium sonneborni]|uniref:Uncharacterized protein n=1 Tax=Paramecium sonneborni TaxID=65129 RepID=A0A8S1PE13_9CILI|nr:unnamed protein product [Paramecium sonneborni]
MTEPKAQYDELYKIILVEDFKCWKDYFSNQINKTCFKEVIAIYYWWRILSLLVSLINFTCRYNYYCKISNLGYCPHYRISEGALLFYDLCDKKIHLIIFQIGVKKQYNIQMIKQQSCQLETNQIYQKKIARVDVFLNKKLNISVNNIICFIMKRGLRKEQV